MVHAEGPVRGEPGPGARECSRAPASALQMFRHTDSLFPILLQTLSDESDEVGPQHPLPVPRLPRLPFSMTGGIS